MYIIVIDHDIDMMQVFSYDSAKEAHTMFNAFKGKKVTLYRQDDISAGMYIVDKVKVGV